MGICRRPPRLAADPRPSMAHHRPALICRPPRVRRPRSIRGQRRPAATQLQQAAPLADRIRRLPTARPVRMEHHLDQRHHPPAMGHHLDQRHHRPAMGHRLDQRQHRPLAMEHHHPAHTDHPQQGSISRSISHVVPRRATVHPSHQPHPRAMVLPHCQHHQHPPPPGMAHPSRLPAATAHQLVPPPAMELPA